jgi:hypothetical protein
VVEVQDLQLDYAAVMQVAPAVICIAELLAVAQASAA